MFRRILKIHLDFLLHHKGRALFFCSTNIETRGITVYRRPKTTPKKTRFDWPILPVKTLHLFLNGHTRSRAACPSRQQTIQPDLLFVAEGPRTQKFVTTTSYQIVYLATISSSRTRLRLLKTYLWKSWYDKTEKQRLPALDGLLLEKHLKLHLESQQFSRLPNYFQDIVRQTVSP